MAHKTLVITGASGFIGQHLVKRLRTVADANLVLVSRKPIPIGDSSEFIQLNKPFHELTSAFWKEIGVDTIDVLFHLGAFIPKTIESANRIHDIYECNLLGTRCLLESLPDRPKRIVFASTIDVYGFPTQGEILDEQSPIRSESLYGASKFFCEKLIQLYCRQNKCEFSILRYGSIFGPGEEAYGKLIPFVIKDLLQEKTPVLFGDGSAERDYLFVDDVVEATLRAAFSSIRELGPLNIVSGKSYPLRQVVETLIQLTGFSRPIQYRHEKQNGHSIRFNNQKMLQLLGKWDFVSLEKGLQQEVEYFRGIVHA